MSTSVTCRVAAFGGLPTGLTMDHRSTEFGGMVLGILENLKAVIQTGDPVILYPSSGTGAWEAALVNTLSPGDRVLAFETGQFANLWRVVAARLGLEVDWVEGDWRSGVEPSEVEGRLNADTAGHIKAVMVVHNETSTGVTSRIPEVRAAMNAACHDALLMVDTISSLGSIDYRHQEWGVDVMVGCSQKGLMLPPGLGINAISQKALAASASAGLARSYWDWRPILDRNEAGFFPYTPPTNLLYGLEVALERLLEEGLQNVLARHARHGEATRRAVRAWGLETCCQNPAEHSNALTGVWLPDGHDADALRRLILERFDMSLGTGLGKVKGRVFRIGHLGDLNDLTLMGTLTGVEMGLGLAGIPHRSKGVLAAMNFLATASGGDSPSPPASA